MIHIVYNKTTKCPGLNSAYITFPYNEQIINVIKKSDCAIYNKKNKEWEVCESDLTKLIDELTQLDDIQIDDNTKIVKQQKHIIPSQFNYNTKPFDYQLAGIEYGLNHDKWLLLDAPGLGKTLQVIYIAQELKKNYNIEHCLIVCGINTLKQNWKNEIQKHSNLDCMILGERVNSKGRIVNGSVKDRLDQLSKKIKEFFIITNIETLRNSDIIKQINSGSNAIDMIVVDEIHACKNSQSQQGKNLLKLKNARYKIGLTGTLIMNSPIDAYAALKWIGAERCNLSTFKHYYIQYGGLFSNEIVGYRNIDYLKKQIADNSLRRTKDLLDLPEKTIINEIVEMEPSQESFYKNILDGVVDQLDKIQLDSNSVLSLVTRLRQATASPSMLTTENIESSKLLRVVDLSEQIIQNNDKVVIFSVFKEPLQILAEKLSNYHPLICSGDVDDNQIQQNISKFQNDIEYKILLCTTSKMGTGVTLTSASYMIFLDTPWTAALCEQCEDRIHRIGSKKPVFIYYLWTNNTFDIQVKQIVEDKSIIGNYVIDDTINQTFIDRLRKLILDLKIS